MNVDEKTMIKAYLFDWGDTLMVDFPDAEGKMCDWEKVEVINHAKETLATLSQISNIYVATGAANSSEKDIQRAFKRAGLNQYISGYFCQENIGCAKGSSDFLNRILDTLNIDSQYVAMVGDTIDKDIKPALSVGLKAFWFNDKQRVTPLEFESNEHVVTINKLTDLYLNHELICQRFPVWESLSELFLDTEITECTRAHIASVLANSEYSLEVLQDILYYEVYPVLKYNLLSVAGEWAGFNREWLIESLVPKINKRSMFSLPLFNKWMFDKEWKEIYLRISSLRLQQG